MLLEGIFLPLTTPFYPDGRLYVRKLEHNVDRYSRTPAAGLIVMGPNSEADGLTDHEAIEILGASIAVAAKEKVMIAGVGRESVFRTLALAEAAAAAGFDAVAVRGPEMLRHAELRREWMTFFGAVADRSPLPVVLMSEVGRALPVDAAVELAGHPNMIGMVDDAAAERMAEIKAGTAGLTREVTVTKVFAAATGRMLKPVAGAGPGSFVSAETLGGGGTALATAPPVAGVQTRTRRVGFQVLAGAGAVMLEGWKAGASGGVPRLGAAAPQVCCEVWQAFKDGDLPLAEEKQARVAEAALRMDSALGASWSKYGCDLNGYFGGRPRLPLIALDGVEREELERMMAGLKN